jgi:tRNA pseudouridine55 synthase
VKIGHGGTLDPLATGVLITGIGNGTKSLSKFLACTKSYETVAVFGAESDSYDILGKVMGTAGTEGVTAESVKEALNKFRGTIKQRPPVYSARRLDGERLYNLARQGKEIPEAALKEREVEVSELELVEFWEKGDHEFVMKTEERAPFGKKPDERRNKKRKHGRSEEDTGESAPPTKAAKLEPTEQSTQVTVEAASSSDLVMSGALPIPDDKPHAANLTEDQDADAKEAPRKVENEKAPDAPSLGPAARIRMTVTSGFYVRSLCHDLGKTLDSAGVMAELVRTRQGEFELGKNVLDFEDLDKGEELWGPKVKAFLEDWQTRTSEG